jgi:hypothetical protein
MTSRYPKAHAYLKRFQEILAARKTQAVRHLVERGAFYSIFGVGRYTLAPWKVTWAEVGNEADAAVVGSANVSTTKKPVIPDHTCVFVDFNRREEAHFVCAAINSSPARLAIRNYIVLHPDPHVLDNISIPRFSSKEIVHIQLAKLSQTAHEAVAKKDSLALKKAEEEIDRCAARLWGLSEQELAEIKRSLEEM